MRVKIRGYGREQTIELAAYLRPEGYHGYDSGGRLEDMQSDIYALQEAFGRLLEHLVTVTRTITLKEAQQIVGKYDDIEPAE